MISGVSGIGGVKITNSSFIIILSISGTTFAPTLSMKDTIFTDDEVEKYGRYLDENHAAMPAMLVYSKIMYGLAKQSSDTNQNEKIVKYTKEYYHFF
mmetsp:Transcript_56906/g.65593  ORF Transcript_56906/g.65593 Transcript_56906/m.65593 type:complete len:97 (+) Transcript_56906:2688-2978(+)